MMRSISIQLSASGFSYFAHVEWFIQQPRVEARKCSQLGVYDNMGCVAYWGNYRKCDDGPEATEARVARAGSLRGCCCAEAEERREVSPWRTEDGEGARLSVAEAVFKTGRSRI